MQNKQLFFTGKNYKGIFEITKTLHDGLSDCILDDETRPMMNAVYCEKENNRISSTDGRHVIIFTIPENIMIESGFYMPVNTNKKYFIIPYDVDAVFPNIDKVIPGSENRIDVMCNENYSDSNNYKKSQFIFKLSTLTKSCIDITYLKILNCLIDFNVNCDSREEEAGKKNIMFYNDQVKYIIMPMIN